MRNPRLYLVVICVGLIARASQRGALNQLDGDFGGWAGLITFWIPLIAVIYVFASILIPAALRRLPKREGR
jgi:hypothetical protein